ncbi:hypothetical protein [Reticulibacter mediterranei]|uniref:hypothetical protein n=1 Tax=Reticulibacter mediterranei TaxID=2778369 RepID=UPI001C688F4C|nr:hypothetical protein [Reticulibacter mediterranei]
MRAKTEPRARSASHAFLATSGLMVSNGGQNHLAMLKPIPSLFVAQSRKSSLSLHAWLGTHDMLVNYNRSAAKQVIATTA